MSTIAGGYSIRGAFTGAISRQFAKADGMITVNDMVTYAVIEMKKDTTTGAAREQAPESRNTLQKILIFPPKAVNPASRKQRQGRLTKEEIFGKLGVHTPSEKYRL